MSVVQKSIVKNNLKSLIIQERARLEIATGSKVNLGAVKTGIANHCGVKYHTIEQIHKGFSAPSMEVALRMAKYFNCKVDDIFYLD